MAGIGFALRRMFNDDSFTKRFTQKTDDCFSIDESLQQLVDKMKIPL
jgi:hypothetical protein